jgi:hypothetical protein
MSEERTVKIFDVATSGPQPDAGLVVSTKGALMVHLSSFLKRDPGILEIVSPEGTRLHLGLGGRYACAQITAANSLPPYLVAQAGETTASEDVEFLLGDTPTPVVPEECISVPEAVRIAEHFFDTGQPDPTITWKKI